MKSNFEAFKGNALQKNPIQRVKQQNFGSRRFNDVTQRYDFDAAWRGSVNNLMSSENITEDLVKESLKELEKAMQESKRMLVGRDDEIAQLRRQLEQAQMSNYEQLGQDEDILAHLEESQKRVLYLEKEMQKLKEEHQEDMRQLKMKSSHDGNNEMREKSFPECTCYCGSVCKALSDLSDYKRKLDCTQKKYDNLKNRVKEFRKQAEIHHRARHNSITNPTQGNIDKASSCSIQ